MTWAHHNHVDENHRQVAASVTHCLGGYEVMADSYSYLSVSYLSMIVCIACETLYYEASSYYKFKVKKGLGCQ